MQLLQQNQDLDDSIAQEEKENLAGARISSTGSIVEVEFDKEMENIEKVLNLFDRQYDIRFNVFQSKNHMNLFIENISEIKKMFNSKMISPIITPQQNKGRFSMIISSLGRKGVKKNIPIIVNNIKYPI